MTFKIQELKEGDVVYLHLPADPLSDHYSKDYFYDRLGIVQRTPNKYTFYARIGLKDDDSGCFYHAGEITKIGEL